MMPSLLGIALALGLGLIAASADAAQAQTGAIRVEVVDAAMPVAGAIVSAGGRSAATDASGVATLTLPPGRVLVTVTKDGYEPATARVDVVAGEERALRLVLPPDPASQERGTIVASTRTGRHIEDQALPVEVLGHGKIEEGMSMTPGNFAPVLEGMNSLRVQTTSPELGTAMVRIQGLRGQYTRLLSDGVPLYFDYSGGLALVQIPTMDLDRVEVVMGGASALFGTNALAGAVNLLSRRPGKEKTREFLFSQSASGGTDGGLWMSSPPAGSWSHSLLVDGHWQDERDANDDGWSDIPGYSRGTVRTHVYWDNKQGKSVSGLAGTTFEKRKGGSSFAHQELETKEASGALFGQMPLGKYTLAGAGTLFVQSRTRDFPDVREHERRESATIEIMLRGTAPRQTWVAGIAADWFTIRTPDPLASAYIAPRGGLFVHDDVDLAPWLSVSGSARLDFVKGAGETLRIDGDYFFSSRGSVLVRGGPWAARFSAGTSYFVPTPLTEETEAAGFARLSIESPLEVETARTLTADLSHTTRASTVSLTVFNTRLDHPALIDRATYTLHTDADPVETHGVQIFGTARRPPFSLTGTYAYLRARERGGVETALTPRHSAGVLAAVEAVGRGRIGVQVSFTGEQRLDANPYRSTGESYVLVNLLGEHLFGRWRVFVNARNLTDVRQTNWDPIARTTRDVDGRWTVDAWAPLEGRVVNLGVKVSF